MNQERTISTTQLRNIVNSGYKLFDFDYPFISGYRDIFEKKFIQHYYYHEIGSTTVDMFKHRLASKLNDIMPYYIQLYNSENLINNPLQNYSIKESYYREHDNDIFKKSLAVERHEENSYTRDSNNLEITSNKNIKFDENGNTKGKLDATVNYKEFQDLYSNEDMSQDINTKGNVTDVLNEIYNENMEQSQNTDNKRIENETINTNNNTNQNVIHDGNENETGTKDVTSNGEVNKTGNEHLTSSKNTMFSDTPQENFVTSNNTGATSYTPISSYATTVTREDNSQDSNSKEDITNNNKENTKYNNDKTNFYTDTTTIKNTVDTNKDNNTDINEIVTIDRSNDHTKDNNNIKNYTDDEDTNRNIKYNSDLDINSDTVKKDLTEGSHIIDNMTNSNMNQSQLGKMQSQKDNIAFILNNEAQDRNDKGITKYTKSSYGYMNNESELLLSFRKTFLNIDRQIIEECESLFLGVYCLIG